MVNLNFAVKIKNIVHFGKIKKVVKIKRISKHLEIDA